MEQLPDHPSSRARRGSADRRASSEEHASAFVARARKQGHAPIQGRISVVRPATGADVGLLVSWHAHPEVARYWGGKTYSQEQIAARLARPQVDAYIVEADDEPVGYLQAWFGETPDVTGLDMFLIPAARGRGLGPDAARTLAQHLLHEAGRTRVTVDPEVWNESAVRSWRRAGFRPVEEREADDEHPHRWLLMEFDSDLDERARGSL